MPADPYQLFDKNGQLSRRELERLAANVYAMGRPAFGTGIRGRSSILGQSIQVDKRQEFWAQITGKDTSTPPRYSFIEARQTGPGRWQPFTTSMGYNDAGGAQPAMESTGNASVPVDGSVFVRMQLADSGDHFVFTYSASGATPLWALITRANPPNNAGHVPFSWRTASADGSGGYGVGDPSGGPPGGNPPPAKGPAYEWNGLDPVLNGVHLLVGVIVQLFPDGHGNYVFLAPLIHGLWLSASCSLNNDGNMIGVTT